MESTTPPRLRRGGVVDEIEMSDGLSVHCVDTTDVVAVDTAHTKDVLSADATDFMSAHTTLTFVQWMVLQDHGSSCRTMIHVREPDFQNYHKFVQNYLFPFVIQARNQVFRSHERCFDP